MKPIFVSLFAMLYAGFADAATTQINCGQFIDTGSGKIRGATKILVEGKKITGVDSAAAGDSDVIDLSDYTCLPGLIDMHVHLTSQSSPKSYLERYTLNKADYAFRAAHYAGKTLRAGFTTVRNLGDDGTVTKSLRDAIAQGLIDGPRIYTSGKSLATTGGHADPSNGYREDLMGDPHAKQGVINGAAEAMKAVRQRYKDGADLIKITATGGVLSTAKSGQNPQFTDEELSALVSTAKDYGFKVAAHAHGAGGMNRAIRAGVDSIEHGTLMDDEGRRLMKRNGTFLVPTILAGEFVAQKAKIDGYFPEIVRPKAIAIGPQLKSNFKKAVDAGVRIAFGTDSGVSAHGDNAQEFQLMVDAGMEPMPAILSATVNAAELLGESEMLGEISAGYWADIIAVRGNPLEDISVLQQVSFVMKAGEVFVSPE